MKALTLSASLLALALFIAARPTPAKGNCSASCDQRASECEEACEARHKDEPKLRVECKLACIEKRALCEKGCP